MQIENMSRLATVILCVSIAMIIFGLFEKWILMAIGIIGLIIFEIISAYIHEWYVDQKEEKY